MTGRGVPVSRYGGVNVSTRSSKWSSGLPPNVATRPSGRSRADEWYTRGTDGSFTSVQVDVLGSKIWVLATGVSPSLTLASGPPVCITVESGRITALTYILIVSIGGPGAYVGVGCERSTIAVVDVAHTGLFCEPPPMTITFWSCAGGSSTLWP